MDDKTATTEYIIIPKSILTDTRLCKPNITEFYGVILSLSRQKGYCFASNSYLADFMKCDIRTITNWVTRLKELEHIRVEYLKDDKTNNITLRKIYPVTGVPIDFSIPTDSNFERVPIDFSGGYGKMDVEGTDPNFHHNNNYIINNINNKNINNMHGANEFASVPEQQSVIELTLKDKTMYPVTQEDIDRWEKLYPAVNVLQELRNMAGWIEGNPTKRKTRRGMPRFINAWLGKAQNKGCSGYGYGNNGADKVNTGSAQNRQPQYGTIL